MASSPCVEISEPTPYYGYIYMWCDVERGKYYVGSHKGSIFDKYKCGSSWLNSVIRKRPETLQMRILEYYFGDDRKELYRIEEKWLKFYDVATHRSYYNFKNNAVGGTGPNKYKGMKRVEYSPGWIDHRKGKTIEEIYRDPESVRKRISDSNREYFIEHGHGRKKGVKHKVVDPRKGKTVEEIYGYRRLVNPNKPFVITVNKPGETSYEVYCKNSPDFYKLMKMETSTLAWLKNNKTKTITRINSMTKHEFPLLTVLEFKFVGDNP